MKLSFEGCDWYKPRDVYQFSLDFDQWLEAALKRRIPDSKEFEEKHGKNWELAFAFRARRRIKKPRTIGPLIDRRCKRRQWIIESPYFVFKSPYTNEYAPLLRQFLEQFVMVLEQEEIDPTKVRRDSEQLLRLFASRRGVLVHEDTEEGVTEVEFDLLEYLSRSAKRVRKLK